MNRFFKLVICLLCSAFISHLPADYPEGEGFLKYKTILTIAGSDPSGGAGIQADLKTFSALHCYGMSAITALTAQNTQGVQAIQSLPSEFVISQLRSIFDDIEVNAIKIGMLERKEMIQQVAKYLKECKTTQCPIIVDPVMFAKSGDQLIEDEAIEVLKNEILPLATILTPNIHEACRLLQIPQISDKMEMEQAAFALLELGPQAVIIKGEMDCLVIKGHPNPYWFEQEHIQTNNVHGTGCTFSAAIASFLARGEDILDSITKAKAYIHHTIETGAKYKIGHGKGPVFHFFSSWPQTFTEEAWEEARPTYEKIQSHPFINAMGDGTLPQELFDSYLLQDYLYLLDREKAFSILASRAPNSELKDYLQELANSAGEGAECISKRYNFHLTHSGEFQKTLACELYTQGMLTAASKMTFNEGLVFLLPCTWLYQEIGEYLQPNSPASNQYKDWIDQYSSLERRSRVNKFRNIIDELAASSSLDEKEALKTAFQKASQHEYDFWDAVYC